MIVTLYRCEDADLTLPIRILKDQMLRWEVKEGLPEALAHLGARLHGHDGWHAYFPAYRLGASRWTEIYEILHTHGRLIR